MFKQMLLSQQYLVAIIFAILLTFIAFGIMSAVTKMAFDKTDDLLQEKLSLAKYLPQIVLIILAISFCFCMNDKFYGFINEAVKCIY